MEKICVAIRVRPPSTSTSTPIQDNSNSNLSSNGTYWKVEDNRISLHKSLGTPISGVSYAFDHVFDQECTNSRVYEHLTKDIIRAAVDGFNGTAFAYGQTSSGKTFTMNGSDNDPGIVPLAVKDIFHNIMMMTDREFLIRVSYLEIYNEEIKDLLAPDDQKLQIHESLERGIFVAGLREEIVNSAEQVLQLIQSGEVNRHFGETNMNTRSSRSHTIFRMVIESKGKDRSSTADYSCVDAIRVSVLNLVDLAGSERIVKTGAGGVRLKEGKYINKSLLVLGNVINKLSDGGKQRGHIPYRDSKLTRILQPALGGNAKTSIICTIAPEEVHIEETRGTLQFASRAKRITNCAQVNEILTDAALLKRQKLEIEELRNKLQGSRSEVLEQEILKLRNDMLKYELDRERLALELEEERKSHKEREQWIRDQQMKIDNHNNLVTSSDHEKNPLQEHVSTIQAFQGESINKQHVCNRDSFHTPSFKAVPSEFVARRSDYSRLPEFSPVPVNLGCVADEDMWIQMNKGYIADLDSLQITPARRTYSLPSSDQSLDYLTDGSKEEVQNLKRELELALREKNELEKNHEKQLLLNDQLMVELSELQQESKRIQDVPQIVSESVASCKAIYKEIFSIMQSFVVDETSSSAKLLSSTSEIGINLLSNLEGHLSVASSTQKVLTEESLIQNQCEELLKHLNDAISTLVSSQAMQVQDKHSTHPRYAQKNKGSCSRRTDTSWNDDFRNEMNAIKERYQVLEKEFNTNNQLLETSKERFHSLERECNLIREERNSLIQKLCVSAQNLSLVTDQKAKISKDLNMEIQRRKDLEKEVKQFSLAFSERQRSFIAVNNEFKAKIENLRRLNPVQYPNLMGTVD
ncbi:Kinesin-like protein [Thalictrum thalictroides]|uniref:Kinesin-like protein n=1 Tax=Thalictrum thalictroides TaxID=46969 RepID=A0A7J6VTM1_THATH|nr:Kinesin-like protein [Thalictrum thalictroides]